MAWRDGGKYCIADFNPVVGFRVKDICDNDFHEADNNYSSSAKKPTKVARNEEYRLYDLIEHSYSWLLMFCFSIRS